MDREEIELISLHVSEIVHCKIHLFRTDSPQKRPVIVCFPAMGVAAKHYQKLATTLTQNGFNVVTADLRGNGHSSVRVSREINFGFNEMLTEEYPAIINQVKKFFPEQPIYLMGHSLGGQLAALYASSHAENVSGLILVASCSVYYQGWDFPHNLGILLSTQTANLIANVLGYFPGRKLGFGGVEARTLIGDWARNARTGRYEVKSSEHDYEKLLAELKIPILAISIETDTFAPPKAVRNLCKKMAKCQTTYFHVGERSGKNKLDHFSWTKSPELVVEKITTWMKNR